MKFKMKLFKNGICLFVGLLLSSTLWTQDHGSIDSIRATLSYFPENTQFSIAFIDEDSTRFMGLKKTKDGMIPVKNQDSIFEIGSITKVFTTTILAKYVEDARVKLNDSIGKYITTPTSSTVSDITFLELANHTSGLSRIPPNINLWEDFNNPYKSYAWKDLNEFLHSSHPSLDSLKKVYDYSNLGMGLLGSILANMDSTNYETILQKYILEPAEMNHSTSQRANLKGQLIKGLNVDGTEAKGWDFDALAGAGAIFSNTSDLSKFVKLHMDERFSFTNLTFSPTYSISDNMSIGLGWHILRQDEEALYWHNGGTSGYISSMIVNQKGKKGVVILTNVSAFHPSARMIDELIMHLIQLN